MPKRRSIKTSSPSDFEPKRKNPISLGSDSNIDNDLKPLTIGGIPTGLEISNDTIASNVENFVTLKEKTQELNVSTIKGNKIPSLEEPQIIFQNTNATDNSSGLWLNVFTDGTTFLKANDGQFAMAGTLMSFITGSSAGEDFLIKSGTFSSNTNILRVDNGGSIFLVESASAATDDAGYGQLWVKNDTPNNLYFTNDAGNDVQITNGSSLAGGGGASALNDLSDVTYSSGDLTITSLDKIIASTALTIQTTDSGGHAADLTFDIDGDAIFDMNSDANNRIKFEFGIAGTDLFQIKADASFNAIEMGGEDGNYSLIKLLAEGGSSANDYFQIFVEAQGVTEISTVDSSGANGILSINPDGQLRFEKPPRVKEQASADADQANYGQIWVKNDTPNNLYFTNDAGNDVQITSGASLAGGGGSSGLNSIVAAMVFG